MSVTVNKNIYGGTPVISGTRIPVCLILAELSENISIADIAEDRDLTEKQIRNMLMWVARKMDPYHRFGTSKEIKK